MASSSSRPHLGAACPKLERAYERLLERMKATYSGVIHANVRVDANGAICPIDIKLWLGDGTANQAILPLSGLDLMDALAVPVPGLPLRIGQSDSDVGVFGTGIVFATTTGFLQHLKLGAPFDRARGDDDRVHSSLVEPLLAKSLQEMEGCLRDVLLETPRSFVAAECLDPILPSMSAFVDRIRTSFAPEGIGLKVQLKHLETWLAPGSPAIVQEGDSIGSLVVAADQDLVGWAAFAECLAAVQLLLSAIRCEIAPAAGTSIRHRNMGSSEGQRTYLDGGFRSFPDSWTFSTGIREACVLAREQRRAVGLLDLGCGSAAPVIEALADGTIEYYIGVDIDAEPLRHARLNLKAIEERRYRVDRLDITRSDAAERIRLHRTRFPEETIWILGANLPYLPTPKRGVLDSSTDGGRRGLDLTPRIPLALAHELGIELVVLNVSTLCDLEGFLETIETTPFLASRFVGTVAPLEEYASRVVDYIRSQKLGRAYDSHHAQIISAFILQRARGVSARKAMMYLERILAMPTLQPEFTVALGKASGQISLFSPVESADSRTLVLSVASIETGSGRRSQHAQ